MKRENLFESLEIDPVLIDMTQRENTALDKKRKRTGKRWLWGTTGAVACFALVLTLWYILPLPGRNTDTPKPLPPYISQEVYVPQWERAEGLRVYSALLQPSLDTLIAAATQDVPRPQSTVLLAAYGKNPSPVLSLLAEETETLPQSVDIAVGEVAGYKFSRKLTGNYVCLDGKKGTTYFDGTYYDVLTGNTVALGEEIYFALNGENVALAQTCFLYYYYTSSGTLPADLRPETAALLGEFDRTGEIGSAEERIAARQSVLAALSENDLLKNELIACGEGETVDALCTYFTDGDTEKILRAWNDADADETYTRLSRLTRCKKSALSALLTEANVEIREFGQSDRYCLFVMGGVSDNGAFTGKHAYRFDRQTKEVLPFHISDTRLKGSSFVLNDAYDTLAVCYADAGAEQGIFFLCPLSADVRTYDMCLLPAEDERLSGLCGNDLKVFSGKASFSSDGSYLIAQYESDVTLEDEDYAKAKALPDYCLVFRANTDGTDTVFPLEGEFVRFAYGDSAVVMKGKDGYRVYNAANGEDWTEYFFGDAPMEGDDGQAVRYTLAAHEYYDWEASTEGIFSIDIRTGERTLIAPADTYAAYAPDADGYSVYLLDARAGEIRAVRLSDGECRFRSALSASFCEETAGDVCFALTATSRGTLIASYYCPGDIYLNEDALRQMIEKDERNRSYPYGSAMRLTHLGRYADAIEYKGLPIYTAYNDSETKGHLNDFAYSALYDVAVEYLADDMLLSKEEMISLVRLYAQAIIPLFDIDADGMIHVDAIMFRAALKDRSTRVDSASYKKLAREYSASRTEFPEELSRYLTEKVLMETECTVEDDEGLIFAIRDRLTEVCTMHYHESSAPGKDGYYDIPPKRLFEMRDAILIMAEEAAPLWDENTEEAQRIISGYDVFPAPPYTPSSKLPTSESGGTGV